MTTYSGYREHGFHLDGPYSRKQSVSPAKFVGLVALVAAGFVVLNLLAQGATV